MKAVFFFKAESRDLLTGKTSVASSDQLVSLIITITSCGSDAGSSSCIGVVG